MSDNEGGSSKIVEIPALAALRLQGGEDPTAEDVELVSSTQEQPQPEDDHVDQAFEMRSAFMTAYLRRPCEIPPPFKLWYISKADVRSQHLQYFCKNGMLPSSPLPAFRMQPDSPIRQPSSSGLRRNHPAHYQDRSQHSASHSVLVQDGRVHRVQFQIHIKCPEQHRPTTRALRGDQLQPQAAQQRVFHGRSGIKSNRYLGPRHMH